MGWPTLDIPDDRLFNSKSRGPSVRIIRLNVRHSLWHTTQMYARTLYIPQTTLLDLILRPSHVASRHCTATETNGRVSEVAVFRQRPALPGELHICGLAATVHDDLPVLQSSGHSQRAHPQTSWSHRKGPSRRLVALPSQQGRPQAAWKHWDVSVHAVLQHVITMGGTNSSIDGGCGIRRENDLRVLQWDPLRPCRHSCSDPLTC